MITQSEIKQICQKENLAFKKIIRTSSRFVLVLTRKKNKDIVLKILRKPKRIFARIAFQKEAGALDFFTKLKNPHLKVPQFLGTGIFKRYPYQKREFIKGEVLEKKDDYFFKKLKRGEIRKISKILSALNRVRLSLIKSGVPNLSDFGKGHFDFTLRLHQREINLFFKKEQIKRLLDLIEKAKKSLSAENAVVVHGEVHPDNLVRDKKGKIFLLDWENIGSGNPAHDPVSVFLRLKENSLSQFFLNNLDFINQRGFQLFFQLEVVLQSLGSLSYFEKSKKQISKKKREMARIHFLKKINEFL